MGIGGFEWVVIVMVVLLLFGAKRIPELARGLGQGINEFRKASDEIKKEIDKGQREIRDAAKFDTASEKKKADNSVGKETAPSDDSNAPNVEDANRESEKRDQ